MNKGLQRFAGDGTVKYEEWEAQVPGTFKADAVWSVKAYRLGLFLSDLAWRDVTKLLKDRRTIGLADQLYRSAGSIGSDIAEGYSRSSGKDQARFYEYALGSARESRHWYYDGRHILGDDVLHHRLELIGEIIRLVLTMIPDRRESAPIRRT